MIQTQQLLMFVIFFRHHSVYATSQWEMALDKKWPLFFDSCVFQTSVHYDNLRNCHVPRMLLNHALINVNVLCVLWGCKDGSNLGLYRLNFLYLSASYQQCPNKLMRMVIVTFTYYFDSFGEWAWNMSMKDIAKHNTILYTVVLRLVQNSH